MKKWTYSFSLPLLIFFAQKLSGQEITEAKPGTFSIAVSHDNVFGFYPAAFGSFNLHENLDFTYYGIFWTNPSFSSAATGTDIWLETGVGLGFPSKNLKWYFNPFFGITHGKLLSGGTKGVIGDGLVPGFTSFYNSEKAEIEIFGSYYKAVRSKGPVTTDYFLYWVLPGLKIHPRITVGVHYEGFILTRATGLDSETQYHVLGGYIKFNAGGRFTFRFSAGKNFKEGTYSSEFYKLGLFIPF
jgi:hypothetical protein